MACRLELLNTIGQCVNSDGGIRVSYLIDCAEIDTPIFDAEGTITNFTMVNIPANLWIKYAYDDDDSAFYNQNGERTNKKHTVTQQGFFKIAGVNHDIVYFANGIRGCCCLVAVHYFNNGTALVQGIDYNEDTLGWTFSKQNVKATINILSDTGDNEDRVEINLNSLGKAFSPDTTLTEAALEAL